MIVLDFETYYDKDFSLSKMTTEAYINDARFEVIGVSIKEDEGEIQWITGTDEEVRSALLSAGVDRKPVCCHNAAFDCAILSWRYGIKPPVIVDTLSMARPVIGLTSSVSLRTLAEHYDIGHKGTEIYNTLGKHRADFTPEELAAFGEYCRQDVNLTYKLYKILAKVTPLREMYLIDLTIRMFTEPKISLDLPLLIKHLDEVRAHKKSLMDSIGLDSRERIMSNPKFAEMLKELGVEPPMKVSPTTGKETYAFAKTDDGFKALLSHPDERVQALAAARLGLKSTIEETRTEMFIGIAKRMGVMPVMLNYYGAVNTGRFSGGDRLNPQNLPRGGVLRQAMRAPEGYKIVACDSSQVEARTLAWFSGEDELTAGFERNEDVYCAFATKVYGRKITKHDNPEERHVGKTCLAEGTEVLTNHGWKAIETVTSDDLLWDGEEWVKHSGVMQNGTKPTLTACGITATPDHLFWDGTKFVPWKTLAQNGILLQKALDSVSLPSSDSQGTPHPEEGDTGGRHTADAVAGGKAAS